MGSRLREVMELHGFSVEEVARRLEVSNKAIYGQWNRAAATLDTLTRYAQGFNEILAARGDRRRFTPESLREGLHPVAVAEGRADPLARARANAREAASGYVWLEPDEDLPLPAGLWDREEWSEQDLVLVAEALTRTVRERGFDVFYTADSLKKTPVGVWGVDMRAEQQGAAYDAKRAAAKARATASEGDARARADAAYELLAELGGPTVVLRDFGEIPCGEPIDVNDDEWRPTPVPRQLLKHGMDEENTILVQVAGTSMVAEDFLPGYLLLVRTDQVPAGQPTLVSTDQGTTVKRCRPRPGGTWELRSSTGDAEADVWQTPEALGYEWLQPVGVVAGTIRSEHVV